MTGIIPDAGVYEQESNAANNAYQQALANIQTKQAQTYQQYGLTADTNADGSYGNVRTDTTNRYGLIQQLGQQQGSQLDQARQQAGAHGIGHLGLGAQYETNLGYGQGAERAGLQSNFLGQLNDLLGSRQQAQGTYQSALTQAQLDALNVAIANQSFNTAPAADNVPVGDDGGYENLSGDPFLTPGVIQAANSNYGAYGAGSVGQVVPNGTTTSPQQQRNIMAAQLAKAIATGNTGLIRQLKNG